MKEESWEEIVAKAKQVTGETESPHRHSMGEVVFNVPGVYITSSSTTAVTYNEATSEDSIAAIRKLTAVNAELVRRCTVMEDAIRTHIDYWRGYDWEDYENLNHLNEVLYDNTREVIKDL